MMIYAIHAPEDDKLAQVIEQMGARGIPTIEVVDCGDYYMALEGSHRLAAAHALGLTPELIIHDQNKLLDVRRYDWYDSAYWGGTIYSAGEIVGELYSVLAVNYRFESI